MMPVRTYIRYELVLHIYTVRDACMRAEASGQDQREDEDPAATGAQVQQGSSNYIDIFQLTDIRTYVRAVLLMGIYC